MKSHKLYSLKLHKCKIFRPIDYEILRKIVCLYNKRSKADFDNLRQMLFYASVSVRDALQRLRINGFIYFDKKNKQWQILRRFMNIQDTFDAFINYINDINHGFYWNIVHKLGFSKLERLRS